jgi:hypothetical protein
MSSALKWIKSSYSSNDGPQCVEVAISPTDPGTTVHVRDSKTRDGAHLAITNSAWTDFLAFTSQR